MSPTVNTIKNTSYEVERPDGSVEWFLTLATAERVVAHDNLCALLEAEVEGVSAASQATFMEVLKYIALDSDNAISLVQLVNDYVNPWRSGTAETNESTGCYDGIVHFNDAKPSGHGMDDPLCYKRPFTLRGYRDGRDMYDDTKWRRALDVFASPPSTEYVKSTGCEEDD